MQLFLTVYLPRQVQDLVVGDAVICGRVRAVGLVYEKFSWVAGPKKRGSVSIVLINGTDLGAFSADEAELHLEPLGSTSLDYRYECVGHLHHCLTQGVFAVAFAEAASLYHAYQHLSAGTTREPAARRLLESAPC